jgi:hypothetical protein
MAIHQIHIRHDPLEDRLLLRLSTTDNCEFRFWLTRRFTKRLWKMLVQMLEWDEAVRQQMDPASRRAVLDLQHAGYSQQGDYSREFEEGSPDSPRRLLLGEAPVLIAKAHGRKRDDGLQVLTLKPMEGHGIDITLDTKLLHMFARLLRQHVAATDWDVNLALYEGAQETASSPETRPRTLN